MYPQYALSLTSLSGCNTTCRLFVPSSGAGGRASVLGADVATCLCASREAGAAGQAAAKAAVARFARADLQPDDAPAGHPGGLLPLPRLQVLPHRR